MQKVFDVFFGYFFWEVVVGWFCFYVGMIIVYL